jgi:hypothetical protein
MSTVYIYFSLRKLQLTSYTERDDSPAEALVTSRLPLSRTLRHLALTGVHVNMFKKVSVFHHNTDLGSEYFLKIKKNI